MGTKKDTRPRAEGMQRYWLLKSDPEVFGFDHLLQCDEQITGWDGVRNYQARNYLRDEINVGDLAFFYHSCVEDPVIRGIVKIVRSGYPDDTACDPKHRYYDPRTSQGGTNPWVRVDIKVHQIFEAPVLRSTFLTLPELQSMRVLQRGCRLSVQPVSSEHFERVCALSQAKSTFPPARKKAALSFHEPERI